MKEHSHGQCICGIAYVVCIKQGQLCYEFFFRAFDLVQKPCRNPWALWAFGKDSFELVFFFPVSGCFHIAWESHWFVSASSTMKHQCVCSFCADVGWQDSKSLSALTKIWWKVGERQLMPATSLQTNLSCTLELPILKFGENTWNRMKAFYFYGPNSPFFFFPFTTSSRPGL